MKHKYLQSHVWYLLQIVLFCIIQRRWASEQYKLWAPPWLVMKQSSRSRPQRAERDIHGEGGERKRGKGGRMSFTAGPPQRLLCSNTCTVLVAVINVNIQTHYIYSDQESQVQALQKSLTIALSPSQFPAFQHWKLIKPGNEAIQFNKVHVGIALYTYT